MDSKTRSTGELTSISLFFVSFHFHHENPDNRLKYRIDAITNTYNADDVGRRRKVTNFTHKIKIYQQFKIVELCVYIWKHHKKYIRMSTHMPGIRLLMFY